MSTASTEVTEPSGAPQAVNPRRYGRSALFSGAARMWRATLPVGLVIIVNAVVQGLLIIPDPPVTMDVSFIASVVISLGCILAMYAVVTASALAAVDGHVGFGEAFSSSGRHLGLFVAWVLGLGIVALAGWLFYLLPGMIILLITAYVPLAAMAGHGNALAANFRAIGARPVRSLVTVVLIGILFWIFHILGAANFFFIRGFTAALIAWIVFGLLALWWTTALACVYRSTPVGNEAA